MRKYLLVVFGIFSVVCGFQFSATSDDSTRDEHGAVVEGGKVGVLAIGIGDCFDLPANALAGFGAVEVVPCHEVHDNQVFAKFELSKSIRGESDEATVAIANGCVDRFADPIGRSYDGVALEIMPFAPTGEGWNRDRGVVCTVFRTDGAKLSYDALLS